MYSKMILAQKREKEHHILLKPSETARMQSLSAPVGAHKNHMRTHRQTVVANQLRTHRLTVVANQLTPQANSTRAQKAVMKPKELAVFTWVTVRVQP